MTEDKENERRTLLHIQFRAEQMAVTASASYVMAPLKKAVIGVIGVNISVMTRADVISTRQAQRWFKHFREGRDSTKRRAGSAPGLGEISVSDASGKARLARSKTRWRDANDEWRDANASGETRMTSGETRMQVARRECKWREANDEWRDANDEWRDANDEWRDANASGETRMTSGETRMRVARRECKWRDANDEWRDANLARDYL
ncbi:hypothetical protein GPALN_005962 [Globodera pallida]|nr:hypothetical protein GPALN_005962 [Globodera pallida]